MIASGRQSGADAGWPLRQLIARTGRRPGLSAEFAVDSTCGGAQRVEGGGFDGPFAARHDERQRTGEVAAGLGERCGEAALAP